MDNQDSFSLPNQNQEGMKSPTDNSHPAPSNNPTPEITPTLPVPETVEPKPEIIPLSATEQQTVEGFKAVLKDTFLVIKKKGLLFFGLTILNFILIGLGVVAISFLSTSRVNAAAFVIALNITIALFMVFIGYLFYGAMSSQAAAVLSNSSLSVKESFTSTAKAFGKAINLVWKIFVYSGAWGILFIMIGFAVFNMFAYSLGPSASLFITIVNFAFPLGALLFFIIPAVRVVRTTTAFPVLMANPQLKAKEALDQAVAMTKGQWWLVVSFATVFSFLLSIIPTAVNLASMFTKIAVLGIVSLIFSIIFGILSYAINISFLQVLREKLSNKNITLKLHPGVLVGAILIFFAPLIIVIALQLMGSTILDLKSYVSFTPNSTTENSLTSTTSSGFLSSTTDTTSQQAITDEENADKNDQERIMNLQRIEYAIEKFHELNGVYPDSSHCIKKFFIKDWPYLDDVILPFQDAKYMQISADLGETYVICSDPAFQYFEDGKYALYLAMENIANGNSNNILKSLPDAENFTSATSGKYYVLVHINENSSTPTTSVTPLTSTVLPTTSSQENQSTPPLVQTSSSQQDSTMATQAPAPKVKRAK